MILLPYLSKRTVAFFLLFFLSVSAFAQGIQISGKVTDNESEPLIGATIALLKPADSTLITGTIAGTTGSFSLQHVMPGRYLIRISFIGYQPAFVTRQVESRNINLGQIRLEATSTVLDAVNVVGRTPPVRQLGDTTETSASSIKVNPDATAEDLVTKMAGITVQGGTIKAQGEDVKKVLVDGHEFFGDDPNAVLKNLPAEIIDKVQVFDQKSEQTQLTGFDDGEQTRTINIVTRQEFRNGWFGRMSGGYGFEDKWKGGMSLNYFQDARRISLLVNTNNVNEQNFSSEDLVGVMSSSGGGRGRGRSGSAGNFLVGQQNGITTTNAMGINYADEWGKMKATGSYFFNHTNNDAFSDIFRQYVTQRNADLGYTENNSSNSKNMNHRFSGRVEWDIDSANSIRFRPQFSLQKNDSYSDMFGENMLLTQVISNTRNLNNSESDGFNFSAPVLYRYTFPKRGRSLTINFNPRYNQNGGEFWYNSLSLYYDDLLRGDTLDQFSNRDVQGLSLNSNLSYTEPLSTYSSLMIGYRNNYNQSESDRATYDYSDYLDQYNVFNSGLSNQYSSNYTAHIGELSYRYNREKWNFGTGISLQYATLRGEQIYPTTYDIVKDFRSVLPNLQVQHRFSRTKNLRFDYRSYNNAPSISQLQNVVDISNPLQLSTGNPDLKQDWRNNFSLRYNTSNSDKLTSFFAVVSGTVSDNYIVRRTIMATADTLVAPGITLARGSQLSLPVNLSGYYSIRTFQNFAFPLRFMKSNLSLNYGGSYSRTPGMLNHSINYAHNYNTGLGFVLSSNISERFDFTLSTNGSYNNIVNTLQESTNSKYFNQDSRFRFQVNPWKGLVFQSDLMHIYNSGLSADFNQNFVLWNAAAGYKFLKSRQAEIRLSMFDILKQNNSIVRNTSETYYEDVRNNVLSQYVLLSFSYNLRSFNSSASNMNEMMQRGQGQRRR